MYRFFAGDLKEPDFDSGDVVLSSHFESAVFEQLAKVLRVKPGDEIVLMTGKNKAPFWEFHFDVVIANKREVRLVFKSKKKNLNELEFGLELVVCLPNKPDKLSMILQKAVELGVSRVVLVKGEFSQMKHDLRPARLEKIMQEAAEQSERALVPALEIRGALCDFIEEIAGDSAAGDVTGLLVAMEREDAGFLPDVLKETFGDIRILVGPEGGFSAGEKDSLHVEGIRCFSLGKRILRMETAVILSLGLAAMRHTQ